MAVCKCGSDMIIKGNKWVCLNCGREVDIPMRVLSQAELLKENEKLKERIAELERIIETRGLSPSVYDDEK